MNDNIEIRIKKFLSTQDNVVFAYIFGSYIKDGSRPRDLDLAVYLKQPGKFSFADFIFSVSQVAGMDNVDVIVLNDASILLQFEIIQTGKLVFSRDERERIKYETKISSLYYDRKYYYDRHVKESLDRIARRGLE